jgi:two-component system sensor histidine kinase MprB
VSSAGTERLAGLIGHELRNPLASAMAGAMLAREMVDEGDPRQPVLDAVLADLDRMASLIDGWLQVARQRAIGRERLQVDELVRRTAERHRAEFVCGCAAVTIAGHPSLLERALENLIENARQAGARSVRLAVQRLHGEVCIHVEDDGCGVPAEHRERIFEPGWSGRGGSGLGLHAVAASVAAHGGSVRCVPLPRGTRFTVTLPAAVEPALA